MLISMGWPQLLCKPSMIPPCCLGIQKLHIHWKCLLDLEFIQTRSATCRPLSSDSAATGRPRRCCFCRKIAWVSAQLMLFCSYVKPTHNKVHLILSCRDVIAESRGSRGHDYDAPFIYRILKSLLPQNNTCFIAMASIVKDAVDTLDQICWLAVLKHLLSLVFWLC